jgi:hypothetical protein
MLRRLLPASIAVAAALALAPPARASEPRILYPDPAFDMRPPPQRWYGWQVLTAAGGMSTLTFVGLSIRNAPLVVTGAFTLPFVGPIIHNLHGQRRTSYISFALNAVALAGGGLIDWAASCLPSRIAQVRGTNDQCAPLHLGRGALVAMQGAILLDALVLSWDTAPPRKRWRSAGPLIAPTIAAIPRGSALGIAGRF